MEWFHRMNAKGLLFSAQCTALDGKCSISCDSEVTTLHTTGKRVQLQAFNFTPFLLTFYFTWSSWQDINCYLIDNNGFILVTEEQSQVMTSGEQEKNFPQAINERLQVITLGFFLHFSVFCCQFTHVVAKVEREGCSLHSWLLNIPPFRKIPGFFHCCLFD